MSNWSNGHCLGLIWIQMSEWEIVIINSRLLLLLPVFVGIVLYYWINGRWKRGVVCYNYWFDWKNHLPLRYESLLQDQPAHWVIAVWLLVCLPLTYQKEEHGRNKLTGDRFYCGINTRTLIIIKIIAIPGTWGGTNLSSPSVQCSFTNFFNTIEASFRIRQGRTNTKK